MTFLPLSTRNGMWVEDFPPETARLLRLADVCGATGVFVFAIVGVALCLGGVGVCIMLLLRFVYRRRNRLFSCCPRRRRVAAPSISANPENPIAASLNTSPNSAPESGAVPSPRSSRHRHKKVGVLELFYPTPVSPRMHAASHYPHLAGDDSDS